MVIVLSGDAEARLKDEAQRRGVAADQLVEDLIREAIDTPRQSPGRATLALLDEWERDQATADPAEIARRQAEFDELKRDMNQTRNSTDGPAARIPFPT